VRGAPPREAYQNDDFKRLNNALDTTYGQDTSAPIHWFTSNAKGMPAGRLRFEGEGRKIEIARSIK
jgi:hypothetical protein